MFDTEVVFEEDAESLEEITRRDLEVWLAEGIQPGVPPELRTQRPGLPLAAMLWSIDVRSVAGPDRVVILQARQRLLSRLQAEFSADVAAVADAVIDTLGHDADADPAFGEQAAASEIRAALHLTRKAADDELAIARSFQRRLPQVWVALVEGRLDRRRARLIVHRTDHLSAPHARRVAAMALQQAPRLTTGQLTALLRRLAAEADPADAKKRYERAIDQRRVVIEPTPDGTANLHLLDLSPEDAIRIGDRLNAAARQLRRSGEGRSMDQLRADVAVDVLLSDREPGRAASAGGSVTLTADLATLAELAEHAGDLGGYGPVIADVARRVAEQSHGAEWRFSVTDQQGRPVHTGTTRRRPSAQQRRDVETRHPRCVFPGCRMPASQCDLDHTTPWAEGGPTAVDNLSPLCRHDHRLRHDAGWSYGRTSDGDFEWCSPLGQRYVTSGRPP